MTSKDQKALIESGLEYLFLACLIFVFFVGCR